MTEISAQKSSKSFIHNIIWSFGTRFWVIACQIFLSLLVSRLMGAESWAILAALTVLIGTVVQFGAFGLTTANTFFVAQDNKNLNSVAHITLIFGLLAGCFLLILLVVLVQVKPDLFGNLPNKLVIIASISIPCQLLLLLNQYILLGMNRVSQFNLLDAISQTILVLNALIAIFFINKNLDSIVILNLIGTVLLCFFGLFLVRRILSEVNLADNFQSKLKLFKQMIQYGVKSYITILIPFIIIRADLLLVNHYRQATETGVYAVASQFSLLLMMLPWVINPLLFPKVAQSQNESADLTCQVTRQTTFLTLIISLLAIPLSFALPMIYGETFKDVTILVLLLLPGVYLLGIESVVVQYFNGTGLPSQIPAFWVIVLIANLTLNLLFIPKYGAFAAAISSSICYGLIFVLVTAFFRHKTQSSMKTIFVVSAKELRELSNKIKKTVF
ncbi:MAG: oligosaccharide flippase family protein [Acidobacteriota bacterium]